MSPSNFKQPRLRDPEWLKIVREMPCVITAAMPSDPSHIRHGLEGGTGLKPPDDLVLPLCHALHEKSHRLGEVVFWTRIMNENPRFMMDCLKSHARQLYRNHRHA